MKRLIMLLIGSFFMTPFIQAQSYQVEWTFDSCAVRPIYRFEFDGIGFIKKEQAQQIADFTYQFSFDNLQHPEVMFFGYDIRNRATVLVGQEPTVQVTSDCTTLSNAKMLDSRPNQLLMSTMAKVRENQTSAQKLSQQLVAAKQNGNDPEPILQEIRANDAKILDLLKKTTQRNAFIGKIVALSSLTSFELNDKNYTDPGEYIAREYFSHADFSDPDYDGIPMIFDAFIGFSQQIAGIKTESVLKKIYVDDMLDAFPAGSKAYQYALGAVAMAYKSEKTKELHQFTNRYIKEYAHSGSPNVLQLKQELERSKAGAAAGGVAPDFTLPTPEDESVSLSDFKGKVTLIDFWASWCGPCRRENPHVVKLYQQYKDQGFEVLGVSLDTKKDRWVKAIADDNLTWTHVSDLKGWRSSAAQLYGVRSIPHTVLVDKEGKIIARNLRGDALSQALAQQFGPE